MDDKTKVLTKNGYEGDPEQGERRETELSMEECEAFRMLARLTENTWRKITCGCSFLQKRSAGIWQS